MAFSVYIIHCHPLIWAMLDERFVSYASFPVIGIVSAVVVTVTIIYILCCVLDYFRSLIFKVINLDTRVKKVEDFLMKTIDKY